MWKGIQVERRTEQSHRVSENMEGWTDPRPNLAEVTKHHVQSAKGGNRDRERRRATVRRISDAVLGTPPKSSFNCHVIL